MFAGSIVTVRRTVLQGDQEPKRYFQVLMRCRAVSQTQSCAGQREVRRPEETITIRVYGHKSGRVFRILWYDRNHGDPRKAVCPSRKRHT